MAETLLSALRGIKHYDPEASCPREENFADLFPYMGDKAAQDSIRAATPERRHCNLLAKRSDACFMCKLSGIPYEGQDRKAIHVAANNIELVSDAIDLASWFELGIIDRAGLLKLSPDEVEAILVVRKYERFEMVELQSRLMGGLLGAGNG